MRWPAHAKTHARCPTRTRKFSRVDRLWALERSFTLDSKLAPLFTLSLGPDEREAARERAQLAPHPDHKLAHSPAPKAQDSMNNRAQRIGERHGSRAPKGSVSFGARPTATLRSNWIQIESISIRLENPTHCFVRGRGLAARSAGHNCQCYLYSQFIDPRARTS